MPASQHRENGFIDSSTANAPVGPGEATPNGHASPARLPSPATTPLAGALRADRSTAASARDQPPLFPLARVHDKLIIALASNMSGPNGDTFMCLAIKEFTDSCREAFEDLSGDHGKMQQLGRRIINYIHTLHTLCLSNDKCLYHVEKLSDLIALYVMCELSYADVFGDSRQSITNRLIFTILKYTEAGSEACSKATIRRVFVEVQKFYKQDQIVEDLLQRFLLADACEGCREPRAVYDDDTYIEYLIIFNQAKSLYKDDDEQRRRFIARAGELVQPGVSLLTNAAYASVLPPFTLNGRATEQILKRLYHTKDLRDAYRYENSFGRKVAPQLNPEARQYFENLMHCLTSSACHADFLKCGHGGRMTQIDLTLDGDDEEEEEDGVVPVNGATTSAGQRAKASSKPTRTATTPKTTKTTTVLPALSSGRILGSLTSSPAEEIICLASDDEDEAVATRQPVPNPVNGRADWPHFLTNPVADEVAVAARPPAAADSPMGEMAAPPPAREASMTLLIAASYSCDMLHQHVVQEAATNGASSLNGHERVDEEEPEVHEEDSQSSSGPADGPSDAPVTPVPQPPEKSPPHGPGGKKKVRFNDRHLGPTKRKSLKISAGRRAIKPIIVGACGGSKPTPAAALRRGSVERVRSPAKTAHVNELPSLFSGYKVQQIDSLVSSAPSPPPPPLPQRPRSPAVVPLTNDAAAKAQRPDTVAALFAKIMPTKRPSTTTKATTKCAGGVLAKKKMAAASGAREMSLQKQVVVRNAAAHTTAAAAAAGRCVQQEGAAAQPRRRLESVLPRQQQQQQSYILLHQQAQHLLQQQQTFSNDTSNTVQPGGGETFPGDKSQYNNNNNNRPSLLHHLTTRTTPQPPPPPPPLTPPPPKPSSTDTGPHRTPKRLASSVGQATSRRRRRQLRHESADDPTYCAPPGCLAAAAESGGAATATSATTRRSAATTSGRRAYNTRSQSADLRGMPHEGGGIWPCRVRVKRCPVATRLARALLLGDDGETAPVDAPVAGGGATITTIAGKTGTTERTACGVDEERPQPCLSLNHTQPQLPLFVEQVGAGVDSCDSFSSGNEWWLPTPKIVVQAQINNNNIQHDDNNNKNDGSADVDSGGSGRSEAASTTGREHNGVSKNTINTSTPIGVTCTTTNIINTTNIISDTTSNINTSTSDTNSTISNTNTGNTVSDIIINTTNATINITTPNGVVVPTTSTLGANHISTTTVNNLDTAINFGKTSNNTIATTIIASDGFNPTNGTVTIRELFHMPPFAATLNHNNNKKRSTSLPQLPSYEHNHRHRHHRNHMISDDDDDDDDAFACGTIAPGLNGLPAGDKEFAALLRATMNGLSSSGLSCNNGRTKTATTTTTTSSSSPSSLMATPPNRTPCSTPTPILLRYLLDNAAVIHAVDDDVSASRAASPATAAAATTSLLNMMSMEEASPDGPAFLFNGESRHAEHSSIATATASRHQRHHQHHHHQQQPAEMARTD